MPLQKQNININFSGGVQTKTDPYQLQPGEFLNLENSVFIKGGLLQKRNGFKALASLPNATSNFLTTFDNGLTAIGTQLEALSTGYGQWVNRGTIQPMSIQTLELIRNNTNQFQVDATVSPNGLVATVYTDQDPSNLALRVYKYAVADVLTGQNIISPTLLPADAAVGTPRVFLLGNYFVIVFTRLITAAYHLQYIAVSINNPALVTTPADIVTSYNPTTTVAWDGVVFNNTLYFIWNQTGVRAAYLTANLILSSSILINGGSGASFASLTADTFNHVLWASYYDVGTTNLFTQALSPILASVLSPTLVATGQTLLNLTSAANNGVNALFYEQANNYSYDAGIPTHLVLKKTVTQAGVVSPQSVVLRSVGLASKAFYMNGLIYFLVAYQSPYQDTYFLTDSNGHIVAELAYSNGGGYLLTGLPSVTVNGNTAQIGYLIKDLIQAVNKNTNVPAGSQVAGVYSQTGINLVTFTFNPKEISSADIGNNLNILGGITWAYDGYSVTEQGFFLYPDSVEAVASLTVGSMTPQQYFYQVTYEWTDNQGNAFRSAPSIPVTVTLTTETSVDIHIPTLRLTYKTANPVKIVIYRWSAGLPNYYQTTSIITPILNDPTIDSITYNDKNIDTTILGNNLLYTTGGILENIGPPSFENVFIFDDRLWGIANEDKNLLWYSKQILEATPVEFSDLQTIYVAPNIGAQGSTGPLRCGSQMDDKAILFKNSAINYINGTGPDSTGANSQYSQPIFITSTVGCSNQKSIIFQPQGLMFEFASEAGNQIWLLGRDLSTSYIGAPVEKFTLNDTVESAVNIPGTNEVRFTMSSGITLMYDYYYQKWGTFTGIPAISSTLYQGLHTYINQFGQVFQENPGSYLDGSSPVLMSFSTSWFNLAGLQGYERIYWLLLLGTYFSPHKLNIQIAYDYNPNPTQMSTISPQNFAGFYGSDLTYGSGLLYGAPSAIEQWRIFLQRQRCQSFQITLSETYDPLLGVPASAGFTLSGINGVIGIKKGHYPLRADQSVG